MCNTCENFDLKIEQFRKLMTPGLDKLSLGLMRSSIEALEADKAEFKCTENKRSEAASLATRHSPE